MRKPSRPSLKLCFLYRVSINLPLHRIDDPLCLSSRLSVVPFRLEIRSRALFQDNNKLIPLSLLLLPLPLSLRPTLLARYNTCSPINANYTFRVSVERVSGEMSLSLRPRDRRERR